MTRQQSAGAPPLHRITIHKYSRTVGPTLLASSADNTKHCVDLPGEPWLKAMPSGQDTYHTVTTVLSRAWQPTVVKQTHRGIHVGPGEGLLKVSRALPPK